MIFQFLNEKKGERRMKKTLSIVIALLVALAVCSSLPFIAIADLSATELWHVPTTNNRAIDAADSGDVNGDGIADVAILTYGGTLQVIRKDGTEIWSNSTGFAGGSPGICDIDGDCKGEVCAFGRLDATGAICCYDDDGTQLWLFTSSSTGIFGYAAFLNLDSDAQLEIFVTATAGYGAASTSYALDTDGSVMWSFSTPELGNQMIHTDVTGDGIPEIILATFQNVYVLNKSGSLIWQYTPDLEMHNAYIMAGDITGDGIDDLAVSRFDFFFNTLYVIKNDGVELWQKSYGCDTYYNLSIPLVIDVDNDGAKEVVVYGGGAIRAYDQDGTELWAWGNSTFLPYYCWPGHCDVNRDMKEEIVFDKDSHVYALSLEGNLVMDFALPNNGAFILSGTGGHVRGRETPRWGEAADVNNDGFDELIIQENIDGQYYVAAVLPPLPAISWEYVFKDPKRGTVLKISTDDKYFQFIAPGKDFGIKHDPNMQVFNRAITICYQDKQMCLWATAIDYRVRLCSAVAWDKQTGKTYLLIDISFCPRSYRYCFDI